MNKYKKAFTLIGMGIGFCTLVVFQFVLAVLGFYVRAHGFWLIVGC